MHHGRCGREVPEQSDAVGGVRPHAAKKNWRADGENPAQLSGRQRDVDMVDDGGQPCGVGRSVAQGKMLGPPFTDVDARVRALAPIE